MNIAAHVITVSDRCASGEAKDLSGPLAAKLLAKHGVTVTNIAVVPDNIEDIAAALTAALQSKSRLILTTGGTGISPRDVTPEATAAFLTIRLDGLADSIRRQGEPHAPNACLSRGLAGISSRGPNAALIVNAPGSRGGVTDTVSVIGPLLPHIIDQLNGGDHPR